MVDDLQGMGSRGGLRRAFRSARIALLASLLVPVGAAASSDPATTDRFVRSGLYVVAIDVARSTAFYQGVFAREPTLRTPDFVAFDIAGGLFGIASRAAFARDAVPGGTVVPYIRVRDIEAEFSRIRQVASASLLTREIVREERVALFKIADPDGNVVEFFAVAAPS